MSKRYEIDLSLPKPIGIPIQEKIPYVPKEASKPVRARSRVAIVSADFNRWKKTSSYEKWNTEQFLKQGGTCYYCDEPLKGTKQNVEHIDPRSRGGTNSLSNLVLACHRCNKNKGSMKLSKKTKERLSKKNAKKKGTYKATMSMYKSEEELGYELKQMFR